MKLKENLGLKVHVFHLFPVKLRNKLIQLQDLWHQRWRTALWFLQATPVKSGVQPGMTKQENHLAMCYHWKITVKKGYYSDRATKIQS